MIAYLDAPSGISGDMFLGCLVDAGWPIGELRDVLSRLPLPEGALDVSAESTMRGPFRATLVSVIADEPHAPHRHLRHIREIIGAADLPDPVAAGAIATFERLARAEAAVHGSDPEKIHFHEVGALDAIADIVGVTAGLRAMGIERLHASPLPLGGGWIDAAHGRMPLPAPATLELLAEAGAPTRQAPGEGELVTPTGAALVAQFARFGQPEMRLRTIGIGCGRSEFTWPNVARLWLGTPTGEGAIVQIETNIDDMNPQFYARVCDRLFAAGALDVWTTPVQMKKQRPAVVLSVLAPVSCEEALVDILLRETTTLGARVHAVRRHEAVREIRPVKTPWGEVAVKLKRVGGEVIGAMPEYEDCQRAADEASVPVQRVHAAAMTATLGLFAADGDA